MNTRGEGSLEYNLDKNSFGVGWFFLCFCYFFKKKKSVSVQKFTHLKLQKFQFIFSSLQSLDPSTDRISLQQQEDGGIVAL